MSDVAAECVSGRKCHRLSSSTDPSLTMGFISTRLDCAHLTELWEEFSSQLADIKSLKPPTCREPICSWWTRHFSLCHLLVRSRKAVFEEKLMELQHSSILRGRHQEERADAAWYPGFWRTRTLHYSCALRKSWPALVLLLCEGSFSATAMIKSKQHSCQRSQSSYKRAITASERAWDKAADAELSLRKRSSTLILVHILLHIQCSLLY